MQRTQVGIIGAGPAGLLLSHLLAQAGIDSVVLEHRSRAYVEGRIRAGVIEHDAAQLLIDAGIGSRLQAEGLPHHGIELRFGGQTRRIDFHDLTGRQVVVYGQHEVVKDLIAARLAAGGRIHFDTEVTGLEGVETDRPVIRFQNGSGELELACDLIAGCDGFHGITRTAVPAADLQVFDRIYPFAWLGILAEAPPPSHELIYTHHANGFALTSMRSRTISRHYLQCPPDDDIAQWSDDRIWSELRTRLAGPDSPELPSGPILQKSITAMRSFVAAPMRHGRLFLAGDAAHIVPPTGAKGMNLAFADIRLLAPAMTAFFSRGDTTGLDAYSDAALRRIWLVQRFSWWMTAMLHRFDTDNAFDIRRQVAELDYVTSSRAAATSLAENYVGLPFAA